MNNTTWKLIEERFNKWPEARGSSVAPQDFDKAMAFFGAQIDPDYREFVLRYGGGAVGSEPIYGLRKAQFVGNVAGLSSSPDITQWFRSQRWPGVDEWLIFSVDKGGNPIGFAKDGTVWLSDKLDFPDLVQLASGFEDFLLKWCLKVRSN